MCIDHIILGCSGLVPSIQVHHLPAQRDTTEIKLLLFSVAINLFETNSPFPSAV